MSLIRSTNGRSGVYRIDRDRRRCDDDPLERVQVHAERVGQDRLDDVAVRADRCGTRGPDDVPASSADRVGRRRRGGRPAARPARRPRLPHESRMAATARAETAASPSPPGNDGGGRDGAARRATAVRSARSFSAPTGPVAVVDLGEPVVDLDRQAESRSASGVDGLPAAVQRRGDQPVDRGRRASAVARSRCRLHAVRLVRARTPGRPAAGEHAGGVGGRPAVPDRSSRRVVASAAAHAGTPFAVTNPVAQRHDQRRRRAPSGTRRTPGWCAGRRTAASRRRVR